MSQEFQPQAWDRDFEFTNPPAYGDDEVHRVYGVALKITAKRQRKANIDYPRVIYIGVVDGMLSAWAEGCMPDATNWGAYMMDVIQWSNASNNPSNITEVFWDEASQLFK